MSGIVSSFTGSETARVVEKHCPIREANLATTLISEKSPIHCLILAVVREESVSDLDAVLHGTIDPCEHFTHGLVVPCSDLTPVTLISKLHSQEAIAIFGKVDGRRRNNSPRDHGTVPWHLLCRDIDEPLKTEDLHGVVNALLIVCDLFQDFGHPFCLFGLDLGKPLNEIGSHIAFIQYAYAQTHFQLISNSEVKLRKPFASPPRRRSGTSTTFQGREWRLLSKAL
ncbi:hypothetical protein KC366_g11 [Hortaea werneckii]|nr:hypothetical protein KC366_g11 [Hortaea werneckii]